MLADVMVLFRWGHGWFGLTGWGAALVFVLVGLLFVSVMGKGAE